MDKSDHSVITFNFHCYLDFTKPKERHDYAKGEYDAMRNSLGSNHWSRGFLEVGKNKSVEELWSLLKTKLMELRDKFVPKVTISNKPLWKGKGFPINKLAQEAIRDKSKKHRKWILSKNTEEGYLSRFDYTQARNKVRRLLRKAKRNYEQGIASQSKTNPKIFWAHARSKLKTKSVVAPLFADVKDNDSLKFDDKEKANILQQQFSSVFNREPDGDIPRIHSRADSSICDLHVTEDMIKKELINLNVNKSVGPDDIHPRLLKELAVHLAEPVALLFNKTITHGVIPQDWKEAYVSPIYKKGSRNHAENYRPISLTSILCKIMESFVREKVLTHLMGNKLLSPKQYGFISGRSTTIQLLHYLDKCIKTIADGNVVDSIYFDFAKAFDTVPHRRLIGKLESYGIKGKVLNWISAFLCGRNQTVRVNGEKSEKADVLSGIPQGTVLGPILFVIYINDILDNIKSDGFLYADDTKIFRKITSREDALILQSDIKSLEEWSKKWQLEFN